MMAMTVMQLKRDYIFSICFEMYFDLLMVIHISQSNEAFICIECGFINLSFTSDLSKCIIILVVNNRISHLKCSKMVLE